MDTTPKTLTQAIRYYSDEQTCIDAVAELRWVDGKPVCPKCGVAEGQRKHYWLEAQKRWKCYSCRKQFSVKVGTPFEDSPLSLEVFLIALWMLCNCKNGVSSYEIARATGIAQKSAWFVLQRLRLILKDTRPVLLGGEGKSVEADETFIGGKARNMHIAKKAMRVTGRGGKDKTAVMGILERGGQVRTVVIPNRRKSAIQGEVRKHVEAGTALYTDFLLSYEGLAGDYAHQVVDHAVEYVNGRIHTNGLENFWSLLKRGINGTYVSIEPFHLFRYLDEQTFRYNNRKNMDDAGRFQKALTQIDGKRLTWAELTGKEQSKAA